jgi:addiction module HigA family antidote
MKTIAPVSPGEMLEEAFLKPLDLTKYHLAINTGIPVYCIEAIVSGQIRIAVETDHLLCKYFGLSAGWWIRGQANYDTAITNQQFGKNFQSKD